MRRPRAWRAFAGLLLLVAAADTLACRCAQRPLSDYFANADLVFLGEAFSAHELKDAVMPIRALVFAPLGDPYRWRSHTSVPPRVEVLTPSSSATCGLQVDVGAIYVVFAWRDGNGAHHTDSCRGTRLAREHGEAGDDLFIDVPRRHLVAQLTALQGLDVLREVGANAPQRRGAGDSGLIGLLDLAWHDRGRGMQLFACPDLESKKLMHVTADSQLALEHRELSYERAAAAVYARRGDWFALRTTEGEPAWALASPPIHFVPYADLVTGRLAYLTAGWSGLVWPGPGAGLPFRVAPGEASETPVDVMDSRRVGGLLWLRVRVLVASPCTGGDETSSKGSGWIPAYGRDGRPNAWYYSRGC